MRRKCREVIQERRGAAMVFVLCILAVFLALALSLLLMSSAVVSTAGAEMNSSRNKIAAVSFSDGLEAELADASSELSQYVREQICSGGWSAGKNSAKIFEYANAEEETSREQKFQDAAVSERTENDRKSAVTVSLYWERPAGLPSLELDGAKLYMEVTRTCGRAGYRLKSEFELSCSDTGAAGESWSWKRKRRG